MNCALGDWLKDLGLGQYAEAFAEHGVDFDLLPELTNDDLKDLGLTRLSDRKRLLKAIAELREVEKPEEARPSPASGQKCYLCLQHKPQPMCPERTPK